MKVVTDEMVKNAEGILERWKEKKANPGPYLVGPSVEQLEDWLFGAWAVLQALELHGLAQLTRDVKE